MKYFLPLLLCVLNLDVNAQLYHFPQPGMIQTEVYHMDWTEQGRPVNYSFAYQHDTIVGGFTYAQFSWMSFPGSNPFYMYYDSGKVYYHYNSPSPVNPLAGSLLYDFSLGLGDTITLNAAFVPGSILYTVDSVGTILLANGQTRKYMELTNGFWRVKWIDAIGDIEHGFFYLRDFEGGYEEFICHQDSTGDVYGNSNSSFYCDPLHPVPTAGNNTCDAFSYTVNILGTSCFVCSGNVHVSNISGGVAPYTIRWSDGQSGLQATGVCEGPISVTVKDFNGDSCTRTFVVNQSLSCSIDQHSGSCMGIDTLCIHPLGGSAPYVYQWPNGDFHQCIQVSSAGNYCVTVTDAQGCTSMACVNDVPNNLRGAPVASAPSCQTCCDGNVELFPAGGIHPYVITYPGSPWPSTGNFCSGTYHYCITDSINCMHCDSVILDFSDGISENDMSSPIQVFPNPADNFIHVVSDGKENIATVFSATGVFMEKVILKSADQILDIQSWPAGVYTLSVGNRKWMLVVVH